MTFMTVTKIEAAERQLRQAIRLFFDRADAVSVHTLASASYQILIDICKERGIAREMEDSEILVEIGVKKEVIDSMRQPQNFFKHAHKGAPEETVRFSSDLASYMMVKAAHYYHQIAGQQLEECVILLTWFYTKHPDRAPEQMQALLAKNLLDPNDFAFYANLIKKQCSS